MSDEPVPTTSDTGGKSPANTSSKQGEWGEGEDDFMLPMMQMEDQEDGESSAAFSKRKQQEVFQEQIQAIEYFDPNDGPATEGRLFEKGIFGLWLPAHWKVVGKYLYKYSNRFMPADRYVTAIHIPAITNVLAEGGGTNHGMPHDHVLKVTTRNDALTLCTDEEGLPDTFFKTLQKAFMFHVKPDKGQIVGMRMFWSGKKMLRSFNLHPFLVLRETPANGNDRLLWKSNVQSVRDPVFSSFQLDLRGTTGPFVLEGFSFRQNGEHMYLGKYKFDNLERLLMSTQEGHYIFDDARASCFYRNSGIARVEASFPYGTEQVQRAWELHLEAKHVIRADLGGMAASDVYLEVFTTPLGYGKKVCVYRTETHYDATEVTFAPVYLTEDLMGPNVTDAMIEFKFWNRKNTGRNEFLGAIEMPFRECFVSRCSYPIIDPARQERLQRLYANSGVMNILHFATAPAIAKPKYVNFQVACEGLDNKEMLGLFPSSPFLQIRATNVVNGKAKDRTVVYRTKPIKRCPDPNFPSFSVAVDQLGGHYRDISLELFHCHPSGIHPLIGKFDANLSLLRSPQAEFAVVNPKDVGNPLYMNSGITRIVKTAPATLPPRVGEAYVFKMRFDKLKKRAWAYVEILTRPSVPVYSSNPRTPQTIDRWEQKKKLTVVWRSEVIKKKRDGEFQEIYLDKDICGGPDSTVIIRLKDFQQNSVEDVDLGEIRGTLRTLALCSQEIPEALKEVGSKKNALCEAGGSLTITKVREVSKSPIPKALKVQIACEKIENCEMMGKSDPFIEVRKKDGTLLYKSEVLDNELNPVYEPFVFDMASIRDIDAPLDLTIMDWDDDMCFHVLGKMEISLRQMTFQYPWVLIKEEKVGSFGYKNSGFVRFTAMANKAVFSPKGFKFKLRGENLERKWFGFDSPDTFLKVIGIPPGWTPPPEPTDVLSSDDDVCFTDSEESAFEHEADLWVDEEDDFPEMVAMEADGENAGAPPSDTEEEDEDELDLDFGMKDEENGEEGGFGDWFKDKPAPYLPPPVKGTTLTRTNVLFDTDTPVWEEITLTIRETGGLDEAFDVHLVSFDKDGNEHKSCGYFRTTLRELSMPRARFAIRDPERIGKMGYNHCGIIHVESLEPMFKLPRITNDPTFRLSIGLRDVDYTDPFVQVSAFPFLEDRDGQKRRATLPTVVAKSCQPMDPDEEAFNDVILSESMCGGLDYPVYLEVFDFGDDGLVGHKIVGGCVTTLRDLLLPYALYGLIDPAKKRSAGLLEIRGAEPCDILEHHAKAFKLSCMASGLDDADKVPVSKLFDQKSFLGKVGAAVADSIINGVKAGAETVFRGKKDVSDPFFTLTSLPWPDETFSHLGSERQRFLGKKTTTAGAMGPIRPTCIFRSNVEQDTLEPTWEDCVVSVASLGGMDGPVLLGIWDFDDDGDHGCIGYRFVTLRQLTLPGIAFEVFNPAEADRLLYRNSGVFIVSEAEGMGNIPESPPALKVGLTLTGVEKKEMFGLGKSDVFVEVTAEPFKKMKRKMPAKAQPAAKPQQSQHNGMLSEAYGEKPEELKTEEEKKKEAETPAPSPWDYAGVKNYTANLLAAYSAWSVDMAISPSAICVFRSPVHEHAEDCEIQPFTLDQRMTSGLDTPLLIAAYNHKDNGQHELIGQAVTTFRLLASGNQDVALSNPAKGGLFYRGSGRLMIQSDPCPVEKDPVAYRFSISAKDLINTDGLLGKADPYLEVFATPKGKTQPVCVYRSESHNNDSAPVFEDFVLPKEALGCRDMPVFIQVVDEEEGRGKGGVEWGQQFVGGCVTTPRMMEGQYEPLQEFLFDPAKKGSPFYRNSGLITVNCEVLDRMPPPPPGWEFTFSISKLAKKCVKGGGKKKLFVRVEAEPRAGWDPVWVYESEIMEKQAGHEADQKLLPIRLFPQLVGGSLDSEFRLQLWVAADDGLFMACQSAVTLRQMLGRYPLPLLDPSNTDPFYVNSGFLKIANISELTIEDVPIIPYSIALKFSCTKLENKDGLGGKSDPFLQIMHKGSVPDFFGSDLTAAPVVLARSQHFQDEPNPQFPPVMLDVLACGGEDRPLLISAWDFEKDGNHELIGCYETTYRLLCGKRVNDNWPLIDPAREKKFMYKNSGYIALEGVEECPAVSLCPAFSLQMGVMHAEKKDFFSQSDVRLVVRGSAFRCTNTVSLYTSEVHQDSSDAIFKPFTLEQSSVGGLDHPLTIEVYDWDKEQHGTKHEYIGSVTTTLRSLTLPGPVFPLVNNRKAGRWLYQNSGYLSVVCSDPQTRVEPHWGEATLDFCVSNVKKTHWMKKNDSFMIFKGLPFPPKERPVPAQKNHFELYGDPSAGTRGQKEARNRDFSSEDAATTHLCYQGKLVLPTPNAAIQSYWETLGYQEVPILRLPPVPDSQDATWGRVTLNAAAFGGLDGHVLCELYDWEPNGGHVLVGTCESSPRQLAAGLGGALHNHKDKFVGVFSVRNASTSVGRTQVVIPKSVSFNLRSDLSPEGGGWQISSGKQVLVRVPDGGAGCQVVVPKVPVIGLDTPLGLQIWREGAMLGETVASLRELSQAMGFPFPLVDFTQKGNQGCCVVENFSFQ